MTKGMPALPKFAVPKGKAAPVPKGRAAAAAAAAAATAAAAPPPPRPLARHDSGGSGSSLDVKTCSICTASSSTAAWAFYKIGGGGVHDPDGDGCAKCYKTWIDAFELKGTFPHVLQLATENPDFARSFLRVLFLYFYFHCSPEKSGYVDWGGEGNSIPTWEVASILHHLSEVAHIWWHCLALYRRYAYIVVYHV